MRFAPLGRLSRGRSLATIMPECRNSRSSRRDTGEVRVENSQSSLLVSLRISRDGTRAARGIVAGFQLSAAAVDVTAEALDWTEFDPAGVGKGFFTGGIDDLDQRTVGAGGRKPSEHRPDFAHRRPEVGQHDNFVSAAGTKDGGRLARTASSCSIACAILSITLRLCGRVHQAGNADASRRRKPIVRRAQT